MNLVRKYINELTAEEVCDIVNSYEMCMNHNWVTHEGTPYVRHTWIFLDRYFPDDPLINTSRRWDYEEKIINEAHRRLALMFISHF